MADDSNKDFINNLNTEYYKIATIVTDYDKNLLTVKGWGVTLSLAALAWGFQQQHYGLFLVAALSGIAFWLIEAVMKRHQMRFYVRMREIEVICYEITDFKIKENTKVSTPAIDWSWRTGSEISESGEYRWQPPKNEKRNTSFLFAVFFPHVFLPHLITAIVGTIFFILGLTNNLNKMPL